jgi:signal transduction histidine kinase
MDTTDPRVTATRGLRYYFLFQTLAIAVVSVMAFGLVEIWANVMLFHTSDYEPGYMLGMMGPTALAMGIVSAINLGAARRRIDLILAGEAPRESRLPKKWLSLEACALALASAAFFLAIELALRPLTGSVHSYPPLALADMTLAMGIIMGLVCFFTLRDAKLRIIRSLLEIIRSFPAEANPRWLEAMRRFDESNIALRLRKWFAALSVGIVVLSVMTFGLVDFVANIVLSENPHYNPSKMIGMILPMGVVLGLASYGILRVASRYTSRLLKGIERVADGRFDTRLNEAHAGPFREVFANFNRMCEELQDVQTLRDDFINEFSHEFKTPITSINGFAKLLIDERVSDEDRRLYLGIIARESERLAEMSSGALLMSKLDSQHFIVGRESFSLDEQLRQCAIILSPQWTRKGIDLCAELEPVTYAGNAALLHQVWINLLANAIKFTPQGGRIAISLRREGDSYAARVADTGKGMTEEERERAFEKYYQGGTAYSPKGLGLGLAIVKRIVELSGGSVEAQSEEGKGSTFIVRLPAERLVREA